MRIFWKNCKKFPPLASGSWWLWPQTPALLLLPTITTFSSAFLALNAFITLKNKQFCFFHAFTPIFSLKLCSFCSQGAQEYFLPQGAGYPSYATDET